MANDKIINRIINVLERTVVLEEQHKKVVALYILNTYVYENFQFCPLLCITAPTKACGKSTLAELIGALAKNPRLTMNATPAVIFRLIDRDRPCLIADETEMWGGKTKDELSSIFNGGFSKTNATVYRCIQAGDDIREFNVFCPKVVVGIGDFLTNTTMSRCLFINMKRKKKEYTVRRLIEFQDVIEILKEDILEWAETYEPIRLIGRADRESDKLEPIRSLALEFGIDIEDVDFSVHDAEDPNDDEFIMKGILEVTEGEIHVNAGFIATALSMDDRWCDANYGRGITASHVGRLIRQFGYDIPSRPYRIPGTNGPQRWIHIPTLREKVSQYLDLVTDVTDVTDIQDTKVA